MEVCRALRTVIVDAHVHLGDVILSDVLGSGVDVVRDAGPGCRGGWASFDRPPELGRPPTR